MIKLYAERNPVEQGEFYTNHLMAMTEEGLHEKSDITMELAHRDMKIVSYLEELIRLERKITALENNEDNEKL